MYHEQVRSFIKRNHGIPLSATTMELCFSYLAFKYISHTTKSLIVKELSMRVVFKEEARVVVESVIPRRDLITELRGSPDTRVRQYMCDMFETLAAHDSIWGLEILPSCIGTLMSDEKLEIRESALHFLAEVSETPDGAEAVGALFQGRERWPEIPDDRDSRIDQLGCRILQNVAMHEVGSLVIANPGSEMRCISCF
ncbi:hypothetical protein DFH06DRAFT_1437395 [Mycena polygramma]|nr:hypothetical protein DFH06DRAFT_1437395 [Mycena polygramma]